LRLKRGILVSAVKTENQIEPTSTWLKKISVV